MESCLTHMVKASLKILSVQTLKEIAGWILDCDKKVPLRLLCVKSTFRSCKRLGRVLPFQWNCLWLSWTCSICQDTLPIGTVRLPWTCLGGFHILWDWLLCSRDKQILPEKLLALSNLWCKVFCCLIWTFYLLASTLKQDILWILQTYLN